MWELRWWAERCDYLAKELNKPTPGPLPAIRRLSADEWQDEHDFIWKQDLLNDG